MEAKEKKPVPPYVAYKTLSNFVERFKQGLPGRVDRGLMSSMSGAAQSQVTTALRYMGMITEHNHPTELMKRYATGEPEERKAALRQMLEASYPFIFDGRFDFSTSTASQLREAFEANTTATGETVSRCIVFLKDAAIDAGIVVSRFITQKRSRTPGARKKAASPRKDEKPAEKPAGGSPPPYMPPAPAMPATASLLLSGLFQRLPKPGTAWPKVDREQWLQTLQNVLVMEYPETQY